MTASTCHTPKRTGEVYDLCDSDYKLLQEEDKQEFNYRRILKKDDLDGDLPSYAHELHRQVLCLSYHCPPLLTSACTGKHPHPTSAYVPVRQELRDEAVIKFKKVGLAYKVLPPCVQAFHCDSRFLPVAIDTYAYERAHAPTRTPIPHTVAARH